MTNATLYQPHWLRWFMWFWRAVLWVSLALAAYNTLHNNPALLGSWRGTAMFALIGVFLLVYELFEHSDARQNNRWPVPYWQVLSYVIVQISCSLVLLHYSSSFLGVLFALMGQVFAALERRHWLVTIGALVAVISVPLGIDDVIRSRDWAALGGFFCLLPGGSGWPHLSAYCSANATPASS